MGRSHEDGQESSRPANRADSSGPDADIVQARDVHGGVHFHGSDQSAEPVPRQLPSDVRGFVNRSHELEYLDGVLADDHGEPLVVEVSVIAGTAGVGKTSLALHWAHRVRQRFADGQLYVNLRGYDPGPPVTAMRVLDQFLRTLRVPPAAIPPELEARTALYRSLLADRRMLVVLDNAASVSQVRPLLPGTAGCLVLVTSRSRLSGLIARDGARRLTLRTLPEQDAVALLRAVTADYRADDDAGKLVELARLCARLPLALRIAAERAASHPLMDLDELIRDLRDESALWDALTAEDDEESDAVRTVFAWSYRALPEDAARLFRLLGLHPGPEFSAMAAAALADTSVGKVRHLLDVLVGAHLLEQSAPDRYQFHDLLRAYAVDQAQHEISTEDRTVILERVLRWYLYTADSAVAAIAPFDRRIALEPDGAGTTFADYGTAARWYAVERTNLVAATRVAADSGLHRIAWRIPAVLRSVYMHQNAFEDWISASIIGLASTRRLGDRHGEAEILESLGKAYFQSRRLDECADCHVGALAIRREIGDRFGEAVSLNGLGLLHLRRRRLGQARTFFDQSRVVFLELGNRRWEGVVLANLGETCYELGELPEAAEFLLRALEISRDLGDQGCTGNALYTLSMTQRELGHTEDALSSIREALAIADEHDNRTWEAYWLLELGRIHLVTGDPGNALVSFQRAAVLQRQLGDRGREASALDSAGMAYRQLGRLQEAADFHRLAVTGQRELGENWPLAAALDNLAAALDQAGDTAAARENWLEARVVLTDFDDPRALRMRARVNEMLEPR